VLGSTEVPLSVAIGTRKSGGEWCRGYLAAKVRDVDTADAPLRDWTFQMFA
jgi:hypothetical protein